MQIQDNIWKYLKSKLPEFEKISSRGKLLFTCPKVQQHKVKSKSPSCTTISGSDKFYCLTCSWKGNIYDLVKVIEKKDMTDEEVVAFLTDTLKIDTYPELEIYKKLDWSLVPIAQNGKNPIEKDWTNKTHKEKVEWIKWLEQGLNIGLKTGAESNIIAIDVDLHVAPSPEMEEIYKELTASKTLTQNSPHGKHFFYKYDKDIQHSPKIKELLKATIDIRNDGNQILISPSKISHLGYSWVNLDSDIKSVPENVKAKLLSFNKVDKGRKEEMSQDLTPKSTDPIELSNNNLTGCCNDTFTQFGGVLIKLGLPASTIKAILFYLNKNWLKSPMPSNSIEGMIGSLSGYKETEEQTQEKAVYECCELIQTDISAKDIIEHVFPGDNKKRAIVDKYLAQFHKEGKLVRKGRGRYDLKAKVEWTNEEKILVDEIPYKIPYFDDIAHFYPGDIIIVGAPTGKGKTHIAMNFVKQFKDQGIIPYFISLESGSRHEKLAKKLGLTQKDYYISKDPILNPLHIEIESNAVTIIDWLNLGEDFAATPAVFQHFSTEMRIKGGILIIFNQLRDDYRWFAPDLVKQFARLSAKFTYTDNEGIYSYFDVDKITDPKGHYLTTTVPTQFDFDTKELKKRTNI